MKAFFLSFILMLVCFFVSGGALADEKSAYERILESGEIRCGYVVWPPMFIKDPNTGEFSGIFHDYMKTAGKSLGFKINWVEEVTPAGPYEKP